MNDMKTPVFFVLAFVVLAAVWWCGWFGPVTQMFQQIRENTVSSEEQDGNTDSGGSFNDNIFRSRE